MAFCLAFLVSASAAPLSGTKSVGAGGDYSTVGAAISAIQANGLSGPLVVELLPAYVSTGETFPLVFSNLGTSAANTVTLRPKSGAAGLSISSSNTTAATVDLNGAQYVTIDGRAGGTGVTSQLSVANTSTAGVALRFINEASSNVVKYVTVRGVNTSASSGVVVFSTTTGANGNDDNTLDSCDVRDGASTPTNGIYALGTTTTAAQNNSGNTVSNCNIFNFSSSSAVDVAGVRLEAGNTGWTITGSSFYQTATRTPVGGAARGVYVNNAAGGGFVLSGNSIGGSTASAGGSAWSASSSSLDSRFIGIHLNVGTAAASSVQGNVLRNLVWNSDTGIAFGLPGVWSGVYVQAGAVNIGTATGNTIGAGSGKDSITASSHGGISIFGIVSESTGTVSIANNVIGAITAGGATSIIGIQATAGTHTIAGNTIGSPTTLKSFDAPTVSDATFGQSVIGINCTSSVSTVVTGNTVANLHNNMGTLIPIAPARGIVTTAGVNTITGNTVYNISAATRTTNSDNAQSAYGIMQTATVAGQNVSQNVVHSVSNITPTAGVSICGIYYAGPTTGTNIIARNWVHSLALASTSTSSVVYGICFAGGVFTAQNNMVRLGIQADGSGAAGASTWYGIYDAGSEGERNFYHNSVYMGGRQLTGGSTTYAFTSTGVTNDRSMRNNIFFNARTNGDSTSKHYAVSYGGTAVNPTGLISNGNILFVSGVGGVLGRYNSADRTSLYAWQSATGQDITSAVGDPLFANATGNAATVNLHLQASNIAKGGALPVVEVVDDFDGQLRGSVSYGDVGADTGAFTRSSDLFPPVVSCPPLGVGAVVNRTVTGWATITDNVGVSGGASTPRLYFKKSTDADVFGGNTAGDNGWKYVSASNGASPYSFTIDYSRINGGSVSVGDTIQYFVVAQDAAGNLVSSPAGASALTNPPVQNVSAKPAAGVASYGIVNTPVGTKTVGSGGDYATLGAAVGAIQSIGLSGPFVLELRPGYSGAGETFPLVMGNLGSTAVNTVTVRPQAGATGLVISSASTTAATLDLNGAAFVIIDGRPGGVGTSSELTIANTSTSGVALRFINEASNNMVRNSIIRGVNTSATSGVVVFSTTTGTGGNDNNVILNCDIRDGATTPANGVYAQGTTTLAGQSNSSNTISNCHVFNYYSTEIHKTSSGIRLDDGNTGWTLTGNSFFQTASRVGVGANGQTTGVVGIYVNNLAGSGFVIASNFIGGSAPGAAGAPWTATGNTQPYSFTGMVLNVGVSPPTSVQGNVMQNMVWSAGIGTVTGIEVLAGAVNIGTETGNTVGSGTGTGSISLTSGSFSFNMVRGIVSSSTDTVNIASNIIGSITASSDSTSTVSIVGIEVTDGTNTISGNVIGSAATANSLNAANSSTNDQEVVGIRSASDLSTSITNNLVANLNNSTQSSGSSYKTLGIEVTAGTNLITSNTIRNLATTSQNTGILNAASIMGIYLSASSSAQMVSQNVIHSLSNTTATAGVSMIGVYCYGGSGSVMERNQVHSLALSTTSSGSSIYGMLVGSGFSAVYNNIVRLGIGPDGSSTAGSSPIQGIYDINSAESRAYLHNSVYVGGQHLSGTVSTYAFTSVATINARVFQNNIFVNARTTVGGTGKHYAVSYGGSGVNPAGLDSAGNILFVSGVGGLLGRYASVDRGTMALWRAATGQDGASVNLDPQFVNATGNAATVDLHLQASNPAERGGVSTAAATVTTDIDGQARAGLTPTDIGADAGNFTSSSGEIYAPKVSFPTLSNGSTSSRVLTGFASITDNVGVAGGANLPRLYYKKSTDASVFGANSSGVSGWKFVVASNDTSPYSFTMDYSLITGGGVNVGDTVQYFVVAQDEAGNLGSMPAGATASGSPPVQTVNAAPTSGVKSFAILPGLSGTKTVGSGGDYPTLGGAGGLFAAINSGVITSSLVVNITSDFTDAGANVLNQFNTDNYPGGTATLTLQPGSASMKTISGSAASGLLRLNGADRVIVDGRFAGTGRYLTFRNTNTGGFSSTVSLANDSCENTVRYCVLEGAGPSVVDFGPGTVTGNDDNVLENNQIRDLSNTTGRPGKGVSAENVFDVVVNSRNSVSNNEIFNFDEIGVLVQSGGDEAWSISGNNIYEVNPAIYGADGIRCGAGGVNLISGNYVHDLHTTFSQNCGIIIYGKSNTTVVNNRISNFSASSSLTSVYGLLIEGEVGSVCTAVNNRIVLSPSASVNRSIYGITDSGEAGSECNVFHNSVLIGGVTTGSFDSWASLRGGKSTHKSYNNIFFNNRTGGIGDHFAAGAHDDGSYVADNNVYVGTGTDAASFMDRSSSSDAVAMTFEAWRLATGGDARSSAGKVGGGFTTSMFVDAAAGDLHLAPVVNPLLTNAGVPLAGITTDGDGDARSLATPTLGSDESNAPAISDIAVEQPVGEANNIPSGGGRAYGSINVGTYGDLIFVIRNIGNIPLSLTGMPAKVAVTGPDSGAFVVVSAPASPIAGPQGRASFTVRFTPTSPGTKTAVLSIPNDNTTGSEAPFVINLTGTGNALPVITSNGGGSAAALSIVENSSAVAVVSATDAEVPGTQTLTYGIAGDDQALFAINAGTGVLTFVSAPDFEAPSDANGDGIYQVTVNVTDNATPQGSISQSLSVTVVNVNEAPTDIMLAPSQVAENNVGGAAISTLSAVDPDAGQMHTFALVSGLGSADNGVFTLNGNQLYLNASADFETKSIYTLRIRVTDSGAGALTFEKQCVITVQDLPEGKLSGVATVGPTGRYASIGAALSAIRVNGLEGPFVLELQAAYLGSVENFPLVFGGLATSAANTLTIRPAANATGLLLTSSDSTAGTVDLNGTKYLIMDGRPGGAGSVSQLSVANTSVGGRALRFINEASSNVLRYVTFRGVNTSAVDGVVVFSSTTGPNGNDDNVLDSCGIGDGASTPVNCVYSQGTTTTVAQYNSGNTLSNCRLFNFQASLLVDAAGVRLDDGSTAWNLTANSFYQTAVRDGVNASVRPIFINSSGTSFVINDNVIGGSIAGAGGSPWTATGSTQEHRFIGIHLKTGTPMTSSVQGNTIKNMVWASSIFTSAMPGVWSGIYVQAGNVDIGTTSANTIGSGTGNDSIAVTTSGDGGGIFGICTAGGTVSIVNNTIGSVSTYGAQANLGASLVGIYAGSGVLTISGNTLGSLTTPGSLRAASSTNSTPIAAQQVAGILIPFGTTSALVTGNTVANLVNSYTGTSATGQVRGIVVATGVNTLVGNTVRNLSTTSQNTGTATAAAVLGIVQSSTTAGQTVSQNVVHSLSSDSSSATISVIGICFTGSTSGSNVIARNLVHSLSVASAFTSTVTGMHFVTGTFVAQNNMVRVGLSASGASNGVTSTFRGIYDNGTDAGRSFYHNSVYIGGTQTSGANATYAFQSTGTVNVRSFQNNIFFNARNNGGSATSKHYAASYGGTTVNPAGLVSGGNVLFASGAGGVLGFYNSADRTSLVAWQSATGQDTTSMATDPLFINPTGDATVADLHLRAANPEEGGAVPMAAVVADDFDGQARSGPGLDDVGADAGTFVLSADFMAPLVVCPPLSSGSVMNRTLTGWARITDNAGVSGGASAPRLYFKKSTDADVFGGNTAGDNGWKYVSASNGASPYSFTVDYSRINGGSVSVGDTIQYFVVAQDAAGNLGSNPAGASASGSPPVQSINAKPGAGVSSYGILPLITGAKNVGSGGDYTSLSGAGGLFAALNGAVLGGDVVVSITSDLTETGANILNAASLDDPSSAFTVTVKPGSAAMKTISGSVTSGLIRLNGADRVIIDGRFNGTGRFLTFRNTSASATASTLVLLNDASYNTVRNCVWEGAGVGSLAVVSLSTGAVTGNDSNLIVENQVRDLSNTTAVPSTLVTSAGTSSTVANSFNTIRDNELFNFNGFGINITSTGNESWTISGNEIYGTATRTGTLFGMLLQGEGTNLVAGNQIHDLATTSSSCTGMQMTGFSTTTISRNRIVISNVNATTSSVFGLALAGSAGAVVNVINNQIAIVPGAAVDSSITGLSEGDASGVTCNVLHNSVLIGGTASGTKNSWAFKRSNASALTAYGNIFFNARTGGSGGNFAGAIKSSGGSCVLNYNVYAASGTVAEPTGVMDSSTSASPVPTTFAAWQAVIGGDVSSSGGSLGGDFTTAMFVSPLTGNLNLAAPGNPLVSNKGVPVLGVTTDYDGEPRGAVAPDLGADELVSNDPGLIALVLSGGSLAPAFEALTTTYATTVAHSLASLSVTATRSDPNAIVSVNGQAAGAPVSLNIGTNVIAILVTAHDGVATRTYTATVTRQTAFAEWAQTYGTNSDPQALGPNGMPGLLNFAFNVVPGFAGPLRYTGTFAGGGTIAGTGQPVVLSDGAGNRQALFVRRKYHVEAGLSYVPQFSSNLSTWVDSETAPVVLADDGTNQIVGVPFPALLVTQKGLFFHVRVMMNP